MKVDQFIVFIKCLFDLRIINSTTITSDIDERQIMQFFFHFISIVIWFGRSFLHVVKDWCGHIVFGKRSDLIQDADINTLTHYRWSVSESMDSIPFIFEFIFFSCRQC